MDCPACHQPNVDGARFCAKCGALLPLAAEGSEDTLVGQIVGGRYRIKQILGEGGMGRVYLAEQQMGTNVRKVAVKTLQSEYAKDQQVLARFHRECGTVSELEHPNTIQFFDFGQTPDGQLYIAMEFVQGQSLSDAMKPGPIRPDRVLRILAQICGSLEEAHGRGIVHRDLKPDNVILTTRAGQADFVKVLDFGIAKRSEAKDQAQEQKLTQQGMVLGTPPYMSPEQFTGKELDLRSDIYSLGVMAYEMLAGRLPFEADTPWQWATQHMTAQPFPFEASAVSAGIPESMKHAIMRSLSKDRDQRQGTVRQFYEEVAGAASSAGSSPALVGVGANRGGDTSAMPAAGPGQVPSHPGFTPPAGFVPQQQVAHFTPAGGQTFPTTPQRQAGAQPERSGGKGLIIGLGAAAGVLAIVGIVIAVQQMRPKDDAPVATAAPPTVIAPPTATAPEKPTPEQPEPTATKTVTGVGTIKKTAPPASASASAAPVATPALTGDAACAEAKRLADNGDAGAAARVFSGCSGAGAPAAKTAISRSAAASVQRRIFNGDCAGARALVASLAAIGAAAGSEAIVNNDAKCKK